MPSVRPAHSDDFSNIAQIFYEAAHRLAASDYTQEQLQVWAGEKRSAEHWSKRTASLEVRVAMLDGSITGFIGFSRTGHIDLLYTHPAFARRGVARALLLDAERLLVLLAVETAWTEASLTAQRFFQAMGYRVVAEQTVNCNGVEMRNCRMEKHLVRGNGS